MQHYGVVDLGSNSIRLVIYEVKPNRKKTMTASSFRSIVDEKVMAGLSAYVVDGVFTQDGVDKAVSVLNEHLQQAHDLQCKRIEIFATAVLRNCSNSDEAIGKIERGIHAPIHLLSSTDEAHLGFVGATCDRTIKDGALIDLGGGSIEITAIHGGTDVDSRSLRQGCVSSYAQMVNLVMPTPQEVVTIDHTFNARMDEAGDWSEYRAESLYGIGGSVRAAAKMMAALQDAKSVPKGFTRRDLEDLLKLYAEDPRTFSHTAVKAVPERIHTVVPGCVIIAAVMRRLNAKTMEICKYGLREGYLLERYLT